MMKIGVLILAAGYSQRMGKSKASLKFNESGNFLDQLIRQYLLAEVFHIKVITQQSSLPLHHEIKGNTLFPIDFIQNKKPDLGRSYSISLGLQEFQDFDFVFIQNIDNPFTSAKLIELMLKQAHENAAVIPKVGIKKGHPILVPHKFISQILLQPAASFDFRSSFSGLTQQFVVWENKNILANINTKEEYKSWISNFNTKTINS